MCSAFTAINFMVSWEIEWSWLGFGLAFLNYSRIGRVFGVMPPERTLLQARVVLDGTPEQLAKAYQDTHCEIDDFATSKNLFDEPGKDNAA